MEFSFARSAHDAFPAAVSFSEPIRSDTVRRHPGQRSVADIHRHVLLAGKDVNNRISAKKGTK
jgi:hypothetical protein